MLDLLTCSDDHGLAVVALFALPLEHLGPLEHDELPLVIIVELHSLVRDRDLVLTAVQRYPKYH